MPAVEGETTWDAALSPSQTRIRRRRLDWATRRSVAFSCTNALARAEVSAWREGMRRCADVAERKQDRGRLGCKEKARPAPELLCALPVTATDGRTRNNSVIDVAVQHHLQVQRAHIRERKAVLE